MTVPHYFRRPFYQLIKLHDPGALNVSLYPKLMSVLYLSITPPRTLPTWEFVNSYDEILVLLHRECLGLARLVF